MPGYGPLRPRAAWNAFLILIGSALVLRAVCAGGFVGASLGATAFLVLFVLLPGIGLLRLLLPGLGRVEELFLGWAVGQTVLVGLFFPLCMLDLRMLVLGLPLVGLVAWWLGRKRFAGEAASSPPAAELLALALPVLVVLLRSRLEAPEDWCIGWGVDVMFHPANAAELRWNWPMRDPRIAGEGFCYHFFSYASPAATSLVLGLPVREVLSGLCAHHTPLFFALGAFVLARRLGLRPWIASLAVLALVGHCDLGERYGLWTRTRWAFLSPMDFGLYSSQSTALGMCMLLALLCLLHALLEGRRASPGLWALLVAFAAMASGSKGSIVPGLLGALACTIAWLRSRRGTFDRDLSKAFGVILAASLPMTLWLSLHEASYATTMFTFLPLCSLRLSPFANHVAGLLGHAGGDSSTWLGLALLVPWLAGFLGVLGLGLMLWGLARGARRGAFEVLLGCVAVTGVLGACLLAAPGHSHLYFAWPACVAAAVLGGLGAERIAGSGSRRLALAWIGLAWLTLELSAALLPVPRSTRTPHTVHGAWPDYRSALEWSRVHLPRDAVLMIDEPRLCASSWIERRMFFDFADYSPRVYASWDPFRPRSEPPPPSPFRESIELQQRFLRAPTPEDLARIHAIAGASAPLYALQSNVRIRYEPPGFLVDVLACEGPPSFGGEVTAELVHATETVRLWRLP